MTGRLNMQVGIPTTGRREIVSRVLPLLAQQTRAADRIIIAVAADGDLDPSALSGLPLNFEVVRCEKGSCRQRNDIIQRASAADVLLFLDDDFLMAPDYLAQLERLFVNSPDIVMATGDVIADGITGPGLSIEEGMQLLVRTPRGDRRTAAENGDTYNGYGCNMAVRMRVLRASGVTFDEGLPLYGWLEDVDFSRRLAAHGRIIQSSKLRGVHLGVKVGRSAGYSLGYSQIANPVYLMRKGTMDARLAFVQMLRNLIANLFHVARPEPWIDRRGRVMGNMRALVDLAKGRLSPTRIIDLGRPR